MKRKVNKFGSGQGRPIRKQRLRRGWNGTNMVCSPTWELSVAPKSRYTDASYVSLENILFSSAVYEMSYAERCNADAVRQFISAERLREKDVARQHKKQKNPWLAEKLNPIARERRRVRESAERVRKARELFYSLDNTVYHEEYHLHCNPWLAGKFRKPVDRFCQQPEEVDYDFEVEEWEQFVSDYRTCDRQMPGWVHRIETCYEPQFGPETIATVDTILTSLSAYAGQHLTDEMISHLEDLACTFVALQKTTDFVSAGAILSLYFKRFTDKSLVSQVTKYLNEFFTPQSGLEDGIEESESADWVEMMKNLHSNWTSVKDNKLFSHLSKLLGVVVTMELCKVSDVTFKIRDMKVFEPNLKVVHGNSVDIIDAALASVSFFVEVFSMCYKTGSLKPLIVNETAALELDEEFAHICTFWSLVQNGNLKKVRDISENEFDRRLEKLTSQLRSLLPSLKGFDRKLVQDKFTRLLEIKNDYVTMKISSGIRKSPFSLELFGPSSQGKSMIAEQIISALLTSAGLPTGKEYQANYNAGDRYMSNWSTDKLVMTIDDIANEKSDFVEKPPTRAIIDICNNQAYYANMADLASKGKVFVEPEIVMVTTNVKDLDARAYSNCPYSIQRRMHWVITVEAKPQFQYKNSQGKPIGVSSDLVDAQYDGVDAPMIEDIWVLNVERAVAPENLRSRADYEYAEHNGKLLKGVSFEVVLNFLIERYHDHIRNQDNMVLRMRKRQKKMELCGINGCKQIAGHCLKHKLECPPCNVVSEQKIEEGDREAFETYITEQREREMFDEFEDTNYDAIVKADDEARFSSFQPHWGEEIVDSINASGASIYRRLSSDLFGLGAVTEGAASFMILRAGRQFAKHWDWMTLVPTPWLENKRFQSLCMFASQDRIKRNYVWHTSLLWSMIGISSIYARKRVPFVSIPIMGSLSVAGLYLQKNMVNVVKNQFSRELRDRNAIAPMFEELRNKHVGNICKAGGIIAVLYGLSKVYRAWKDGKPRNVPHGSLEPTTQSEIDKRDAEVNPWADVVQRSLPIQNRARTTTIGQLQPMILKNLTYGSIYNKEGTYAVNALFLTSNIALIPQHYFTSDEMKATFRKDDPETTGGTFNAKLSKSTSYFVPGTDLAMCYVPNGGSFGDLSRFLPTGESDKIDFDVVYRKKEGDLLRASGLMYPCDTGHTLRSFRGYQYINMTMDTFKGMCGAVLTSTHKPLILGFHLGGAEGTTHGCAGYLTIDQFVKGYEILDNIEGVCLTGSGEHFERNVMGVSIMTGKPLHKKSPIRFQPHSSKISWFGSCVGHSTFKSRAKPTLISEHVMDVMGAPNIYCKPIESPQWEPWQTCLENMAIPGSMFSPELLHWAILDYKSALIPIFKNELWNHTRPLTDLENWNGVPGKKFLDRIKTNTSIGFPHVGKKEKYLREVEPFGEYTKIVEPVELVQKEIDRLMSCYVLGQRAYPIAKACKKDEVLSKRKCRIFYSNPVALTFLIRKYFLPLLRVLQFYPKISECAVGVNSHGPEWEELHQHIFTFGEHRLFGGDYGKYDQKLPAQLLLAALRILIDCAKCCNYSEQDIKVMKAMAGDIVYAVIAFNGDLIGLSSGTHISGNSLTVILNGICGSLNLRCYFFSQYPPRGGHVLDFRDCVKLMTYGDDNAGSVRSDIERFTIRGASEFLASHGQVYTMPDKESDLQDFLPPEEFEFLKRTSVYHPALGMHVGALVDKSCYKMLHYYLRDKNSPDSEGLACAKNIDTACREWFNHGERVYEEKRKQLIEVAKRADIAHMCEEINKDYSSRVRDWQEKYL